VDETTYNKPSDVLVRHSCQQSTHITRESTPPLPPPQYWPAGKSLTWMIIE